MNQKILETLIKFLVSFFSKEGPEVTVEIPIPIDSPKEPEHKEVEEPKLAGISFTLTHNKFCPDGIFGKLEKEDGIFVAYTLEHSYDNLPKLADGTYTCVRGPHRLHGMTEDFITFEIKDVPAFQGKEVTGILFHWGNYNKDSEGCVLLGSSETPTMIGSSKQTWSDFMKSLEGVDSFQLVVVSQSQ